MRFTKGKQVKEKMKFIVKVVQRNYRSGSVLNANTNAVRCGAELLHIRPGKSTKILRLHVQR